MSKLLRIFDEGVMPALANREDSGRNVRSGDWSSAFRAFNLTAGNLVLGTQIASTHEVYRNSPTARACLEVIAATLSRLPFDVYQNRGVADVEKKIGNHPATKLMQRPNKTLGLSKFMLMFQSWLLYETFGEVFWLLARPRPGALPTEIWVYHPWACTEIYHPTTGQLLAWQMLNAFGAPQFVDPADVVHIPRYDPTNHQTFRPARGTSALQSAGLVTTGDIAAQRHNLGFFARGLHPGGVIEVPELTMTAEEFLAPIRAKLLYKPHEPLVLEGGAKWTESTTTPAEAEFGKTREANAQEITRSLHVPPFLVGLVADYHNENSKAALRSWWVTWLIPQIEAFCTALDLRLLGGNEDQSCWLSTDGVEELQQSATEKLDAAKKLFEMTVPVSQIEKRMKLGIEPYPGWDIPWRSFNMVAVTPEDANPAEPQPVEPPAVGGVQPQPKKGEGSIDSPKEEPTPRLSIEAFTRAIAPAFAAPKKRDSLTVADSTIDAIIAIIRGDDTKLQTLARGFQVKAIETGAGQIVDMLGGGTLVGISNPKVLEFLDTRQNLITSVNETTANKIGAVIREKMAAGETPEAISSFVRAAFNLRASQADLIGQQEVGSALNAGRHEQMLEEGVDGREWISSRDDKVRESHAPGTGVDGEIVSGDEEYSNGLRYPQDPDGPAEEVMRCRCVETAKFNGRGTRIDDRAKYWRAIAGPDSAARALETQMTRKMRRYFFDQRSRVLKALADAGIGA